MSGKPKFPFYLAVLLVIAALVGFAVYRSEIFFPKADDQAKKNGPPDKITPPITMTQAEGPDTSGITTVSEYEFVASQKLEPVTGASDFTELGENRTVRFALNVWAGWAPIIYANNGGAAGKVWKDANGNDFQVELVLIDDPKVMQDAYVSGGVHIGWATLDMLPLFMERLVDEKGDIVDSRLMPRVFQQVDWSNGGDGIVVRGNIKEVRDLRGKTIALAENSPSHYFLLNMLVAAGIQPQVRGEVDLQFTPDAFKAAAAFNNQPQVDACVSWAPDIYKLGDVEGNTLLVDSGTANRLIADVWFARADFARDHPEIVEGLVRGIFDAMDALKEQDAKIQCGGLMATLYDIPPEETMEMFADAYSTGWGDNYQFFVNKNYLANFERVWNNSYYLYRQVGNISRRKVPFDRVMDNTYIKKLGEEEKYKSQVTAKPDFLPTEISQEQVEQSAFLTTTHYIHFFPNNADPYKRTEAGDLYDPNVDFVMDKIGERIGQFERSRIVIEGHTDASMKGQVDEVLVKKLSQDRAQAVRDALVKKYELDVDRFQVAGQGWDKPVPGQESNYAKNRRVEVRILPAEGL